MPKHTVCYIKFLRESGDQKSQKKAFSFFLLINTIKLTKLNKANRVFLQAFIQFLWCIIVLSFYFNFRKVL